ncbi:MAG: RidA family protein [Proteobacteria bacterium]|nr:RidA family protein [Pseudomonadota bacterium]
MTRDDRFHAAVARLGHAFEPSLKAGGNYLPAVRHGETLYVAGQIPKSDRGIVITGRVGDAVSLEAARGAAALCALRALAAVREAVGTLDAVVGVLRLNVFVQSTPEFTQHSEVGDGASDLLIEVLGDAGRHPRTSVGVYSLPKNVPVELDATFAVS